MEYKLESITLRVNYKASYEISNQNNAIFKLKRAKFKSKNHSIIKSTRH